MTEMRADFVGIKGHRKKYHGKTRFDRGNGQKPNEEVNRQLATADQAGTPESSLSGLLPRKSYEFLLHCVSAKYSDFRSSSTYCSNLLDADTGSGMDE